MILNFTFLLVLVLSSTMSSTTVDDISEQIIENALDKAFAPVLARQAEIENNTMASLLTSITVDELPDNLIENCVHEALAPLLARQEARELNTTARLEALQALVS